MMLKCGNDPAFTLRSLSGRLHACPPNRSKTTLIFTSQAARTLWLAAIDQSITVLKAWRLKPTLRSRDCGVQTYICPDRQCIYPPNARIAQRSRNKTQRNDLRLSTCATKAVGRLPNRKGIYGQAVPMFADMNVPRGSLYVVIEARTKVLWKSPSLQNRLSLSTIAFEFLRPRRTLHAEVRDSKDQ